MERRRTAADTRKAFPGDAGSPLLELLLLKALPAERRLPAPAAAAAAASVAATSDAGPGAAAWPHASSEYHQVIDITSIEIYQCLLDLGSTENIWFVIRTFASSKLVDVR